MRLNISAWSIRQPIPPIVLFIVLMLLGATSFSNLSVTRFPNIDIPVVTVTITQAGAAPAELETQVTKRVEDSIAAINGVKHIVSTVSDGTSLVAIQFRLETNSDRALNDVKDAIAKIRADLPRTIDEPIVERIDIEGQSILSYAASAPGMTLEELSWHVDDVIKRKLQGLKGVGRVERYGGVTREIVVSLDPDRLLAMSVSAGDISRQIRATNLDVGGGRGEVGGQEQAIRTLASASTIDSLSDTKIVLPGNREVRLKALGRVEDGNSEPRSFGRLDAQPVVSFSVFRAKGASELTVGQTVEKAIGELRAEYPNVGLTLIDDAVSYTKGNYEAAMKTLMEGAALAVLVVLIFLRNIRATLIAAIALPLSIIPTFWVMSTLGFSLNLISLLGITLVTGILVDDAIVEIENIVRHMRMGKSPYRAAMEAADEIGLAVIAITFTIVAVFAPVSFMEGIAGQYFRQFGLTVAAAVLVSLLVARLITPMMAAYLMKPIALHHGGDGWVMRAYTRFLAFSIGKSRRYGVRLFGRDLGFRVPRAYLTLVVGLALFTASLISTRLLPTGFIPPGDESRIVMSVELPPGATLADTRDVTDGMVRQIKSTIPEVKSVFVLGGTTPTGAGREIRKAAIVVRLVPKAERTLTQKQIEGRLTRLLAELPDIRVWYVNQRGEREASISIVGDDGDSLNAAVAKIEAAMRRVKGFSNVASTRPLDRPEILVKPHLELAAELGVSPESISDTLRIATIGDIGPNLAKFKSGDRLIPIRVQMDEAARGDLRQLQSMRVSNAAGKTIPISALADIGFGQGPSAIDRYDRYRRAVMGADLTGLTVDQAVDIIQTLPEAQNLPKGVRLVPSGDAEISGEVRVGFVQAMSLGMVIVLGVLVLLFGSVFPPLTILLSLPLSFGGVVLALLLTNNPVSMPVFIGVLMLMGVVTKNAIMLVEFAAEERVKGVDRIEAMIDAGRKRARPIVMTTIAMAAGMLPSAYGLGDGGEFRAPMAIAVVGGLLVSTLLSLVFVPSFYIVMDDIGSVVTRLLSRLVVSSGDDDRHESEGALAATMLPPEPLKPVPYKVAAE
ncbi:MAG: efflux RND transporter permease subunit [Beijerinckiaceae bacterium]|nr:efflux RND transporter permease subunit [Beijerinckiaceae bacterium]